MGKQQAGKKNENAKASFSNDIEDLQCSSILGQYSEEEVITQLKGLAMDPCLPQFARDNIQPLWNQILRIRKFMVLEKSEMPWRKRKLEQFVKDKLQAPASLILPNQLKKTKRSRRQLSQASSISSALNSVDSAQSLDQKIVSESHTSSSLVTCDEAFALKQVTTKCSFADDMVGLNCPSKDVPQILDSDESVNGSNPSSPGSLTPNQARHLSISDVVHNLNSPALRKCLEPSHRSTRLLDFVVDHLQRKVIPVGPRFQAEIPEWDETAGTSILKSAYNNDSDNLKWLGSRVWPIGNGNVKSSGRRIGKGRPDSCSCPSPGYSDCVEGHILEKRLLLKCELGPTFSSWKFDEMGEQVSESWLPKEQHILGPLTKKRPSSNGKSFWDRALKCSPKKSKKDIINYYFNVYIPRRMSLQRRLLTTKQVDTDDEEEEEDRAESINSTDLKKRAGGRSPVTPNKKAKYLRSS